MVCYILTANMYVIWELSNQEWWLNIEIFILTNMKQNCTKSEHWDKADIVFYFAKCMEIEVLFQNKRKVHVSFHICISNLDDQNIWMYFISLSTSLFLFPYEKCKYFSYAQNKIKYSKK